MANAIGCIGGHVGGYGSKASAGSKGKARVKASHWDANAVGGYVRCAECATAITYGEAEVAHVVAEANGGHYCPDNVVLTCSGCNNRRGDTDMVYGDVRGDYAHPTTVYGEREGMRRHRALMA